MKKIFCIFFITTAFLTNISAQNGINFQGVARNSNNVVIASQQISLKLSILQGTALGNVEYSETRIVKTNSQGLFTAVIGDSDALSTLGTFNMVDWKQSPKFLKIEMDALGGNSFITLGITQIQSVAYAMYSNGVDANNISGTVPVSKGGTGVGKLSELKASLLLDNVDNTSDVNKPISTATQTMLDSKLNLSDSINKYVTPTQLAAKTFDPSAINSNLSLKANISSPTFTGVVSGITKAMVGLEEVDNTSDLLKPISGATQVQLNLKENIANKSSDVNLGVSDELYPTQKAVKNYVDGITLTGTPDATTTSKGKIVLVGDLTGTADIPRIADNAVTTDKILNLNVTDAKIASINANKVVGDISGSASNVTGIVAIENGGTGGNTASVARTNLGLVIGTDVLAQRTFGTAANKNVENFEIPLSFNTPLIRTSNAISMPQASASVDGYISAANWLTFNNKINATEKAANNGVATLGADGKIPSVQIPAISFQSANVVSTQADMLALTDAVVGSIAIRTDNNLNYVLSRTPASSIGNWVELRTPSTVATVNGFAGPNVELTTNNISEQGNNKYFSEMLSRASVSASAPLGYNAGTGEFSISPATNNQDGYLSATDWSTFNNKQTSFGAQTAKTIYAAPAEADGQPSFRALQAGDVPILNQNTTGNAGTATKLAAPKNINGVPFDGTENITITTPGSAVITTATTSIADPFDFTGSIDLRGSALDYKVAENIANGTNSLLANTTGIANTAFGINTLKSNTIGTANTAVGFETLLSNTTGKFNTALGTFSLRHNTIGVANTAVGSTAMFFNTEGIGNSAFGEWSLRTNTTGSGNTSLGMNTLYSNISGNNNLAAGSNALYKNTTGSNNTGLGRSSLFNNTIGISNTATGAYSLVNNTTGNGNAAFGIESLFRNTTGSDNVGMGAGALYNSTTGNYNIAIGRGSLATNSIGNYNTAIGFRADVAIASLSNATAIGNGALVSLSNTIQLGNKSIENVMTSGAVNAKSFVRNGGTSTQFLKADGSIDERVFILGSEKAIPNGVATLDANGKIPSIQIPSISFQSVKVVANELEMLALNMAVEGSIAIRTDNNKSYVLSTIPANTAANWVELRSPGSIATINGETGPNVILTTDNITEGISAKYFTNNLARAAIGVSTPLTYNTTDGVIGLQTATTGSDGYLSATDWNTFNNKQAIVTAGTGVSIVENVVAIGQDIAPTATPTFAKVNGLQLSLGAGAFEANTAIGINALISNTTGEFNTATGNGALMANTTGLDNASYGSGTLYDNTTGSYNTALGGLALHNNTVGENNTALGFASLDFNITGKFNTASGSRALLNNTIGNYNTAYGAATLLSNRIGNYNTAIGYLAGTTIDGLVNATAIGNQATVATNNTIQLGNAAVLSVKTAGKLTTGVVTYPNTDGLVGQVLSTTGAGTLTWTTPQAADISLLTGILPISKGGTGSDTQNFVDLTNDQTIAGNKSFSSGTVSVGLSNRGANSASVIFPHPDDPAFISHYSSGNQAKMSFSVGDDPTNDYFVFGYGAPSSFVEKVKVYVDGKIIAPADATINGITIGMGLGSAVGNTVLGNSALKTNTTGQFNTALGTQSLKLNTTGSANTAIGNEALVNNTTGNLNIAIGASTLLTNSTGSRNTAVGTSSMYLNTTGVDNAALGYYSLRSNTIGKENTATGNSALVLNTEGSYNTATGTGALYSNTLGNYNTGIGNNASANNTLGIRNTSVGANSLYKNTIGDLNTSIGANALLNNNSGANNTTVGAYSLSGNTTGNDNTSIGASALYAHSTGNFNTAVGSNALFYDITGVKNTAIGYKADVLTGGLTNATALGSEAVVGASNTIALGNPAVISVITAGKLTTGSVTYPNTDGVSGQVITTSGTGTLTWTTAADFVVDLTTNQTVGGIKTFSADGIFNGVRVGKGAGAIASNVVLGDAALTLNTTGIGNTAIGDNALHTNNAGGYNTALGSATLSLNTTGSSNTAVGSSALYRNYDGTNNSAFGVGAMTYNTGGSDNTAIGKNALNSNTGGSYNIAIGVNALFDNITGSNNTVVGKYSGGGIVTGNNNTILGANITGLSDVSDNIIIANGNGAIKARNTGSDWTLTGSVSVGNAAPLASAKLEVSSTTQGFLPPRMTKAQRDAISSPAEGLTIFNTNSKAFEIFNGTNWYSTVHYLGESYGGGTIFYLYDNGQHGLIASSGYQSEGAPWSAGTFINTMALADGIGAGKKNTTIIISRQGYGDGSLYAARICNEYTVTDVNGVIYGDWYLPSSKEAQLMKNAYTIIPNYLIGASHWTSTETSINDPINTTAYYLSNGVPSAKDKSSAIYVRAIRSF